MAELLSEERLTEILRTLPRLTITVVGDFFLDKYLDIDGRLTEKSLETGLDAYQVTRVRTSPGAGGTVTNNLAALGVGRIIALTVIGSDGEGFELRRELARCGLVLDHVLETPQRRTPTYTKPMYDDGSGQARELNRLDIKNRWPMPAELIEELCRRLEQLAASSDAVIVADQVSEPDCGVVTSAIRQRLAELGRRYPQRTIWADSRERIGQFRHVIVKPNYSECLRAVGRQPGEVDLAQAADAAGELGRRTGRPVYCTLGQHGMMVVWSCRHCHVPAFPVQGPIDIVGAGDSTTAAAVCALCCGASPPQAAALGNLVASITVQQVGTTGTATPQQVLERWSQVRDRCPDAIPAPERNPCPR